MNTPLVSVLMTSYNREKYIATSIESVLASSYTNFELIIVDDGSSDRTVEIARSYEEKDSRIKVYINEKNLGDYFNRNKAASYGKGKYIKYVDSDDMIYPHGLEVMVRCMEMFPQAGVGIVSLLNQEERPYPFLLSPKEVYEYHFWGKGIFDTGPLGSIYLRECFLKAGGYSGKRYVGDLEFNLRISALWSVVKMPSSLVFWRQHDEQEYKIEQGLTGFLLPRFPVYVDALKSDLCPLSTHQVKSIIDKIRKQEARQILRIAISKRKPRIAYKLYRDLDLRFGDLVNAVFFMNSKTR